MKYNKLPNSDISVSAIAMGCWAIGGGVPWGEQEESASIATLQAALDEGINFFDTAPRYGNGLSETILGKAFAGRRAKAVIATKVGGANLKREKMIGQCEESLRRLQTDYIDLYQIHWPNRAIQLEESIENLKHLQRIGKIRAWGVSNFGIEDMNRLIELGGCATNQIAYSLLWRGMESNVIPLCNQSKIGILCYSPLMQGLLSGKFSSPDQVPEIRARTRIYAGRRPHARHGEEGCENEVFEAIARIREICGRLEVPMAAAALAWLLHQEAVTSVLAGARAPKQICENAAAASLEFSQDVMRELNQATEEIKRKLGSNFDMWQSSSRIR